MLGAEGTCHAEVQGIWSKGACHKADFKVISTSHSMKAREGTKYKVTREGLGGNVEEAAEGALADFIKAKD